MLVCASELADSMTSCQGLALSEPRVPLGHTRWQNLAAAIVWLIQLESLNIGGQFAKRPAAWQTVAYLGHATESFLQLILHTICPVL
jgi:hypothetical protein